MKLEYLLSNFIKKTQKQKQEIQENQTSMQI